LADGRILDRPGYDPETGILFDPQGTAFPPVPPFPTQYGARQAFEVLTALFKEFPLVDEPSKSVLWSALLSGLARPAVSFVPAHAFTAPSDGTGKSKLIDCVGVLLTGRESAAVSQAIDETEFEKKLGAVLLAGDAIVSIDNCTEPVGSALLCMSLTQSEVQIRSSG
jgi:putative DNA primase/helicase